MRGELGWVGDTKKMRICILKVNLIRREISFLGTREIEGDCDAVCNFHVLSI